MGPSMSPANPSSTGDLRRVRMFAGPNGSGKTSLLRKLAKEYSRQGLFSLHRFLNADDILATLKAGRSVSLAGLPQVPTVAELCAALVQGGRINAMHPFINSVRVENDQIVASPNTADGYVGAAITDFLRDSLLSAGESFSFETVMSHRSKVDFLAEAHVTGYRTYLYFIATESPNLNMLRVRSRVEMGQHAVPEAKVVERYHRSLALLAKAIANSDRAYLFDNSGTEPVWLAEWMPDGRAQLRIPTEELPAWFNKWVLPNFPQLAN